MKTVRYIDYFSKPASSAIRQVWLSENGDVYIEFKGSGTIAGYQAVGKGRFDAMRNAVSAGEYYNHYIKNFYRGIDGNVLFTDARTAPVNVFTQPLPSTGKNSRYEVVFVDNSNNEIVFPTVAADETAALRAAGDFISQLKGLTLKVAKVVHHFD